MTKPAIFFDRDNTLIASDGYLGDPEAVRLVSGAADAIARARALGFTIVTFSNQSGVARGLFSEDAVHAVNARMEQLLQEENSQAMIDRHEFCPYHPQALLEKYRQETDLRKPKPGMIRRAAHAMDLDLSASWVIGDAPRDIEAGHTAGCHTILVTDQSLAPSAAAAEPGSVDPDEAVSTLAEAMDIIEAVASAGQSSSQTEKNLSDLEISRRRLRLTSSSSESEEVESAPKSQSTVHSMDESNEPPRPQNDPVIPEMPEPGRPPIAPAPPLAATAEATAQPPKMESLLHEILDQIRRRNQHGKNDFSVSKLLAGVTQVLALAAVVAAYFYRNPVGAPDPIPPLLLAIFIEVFTIALLLMGRDR